MKKKNHIEVALKKFGDDFRLPIYAKVGDLPWQWYGLADGQELLAPDVSMFAPFESIFISKE